MGRSDFCQQYDPLQMSEMGVRRDKAALSPAQTGQGSGVVNACTFLGGSAGVAGGAIAVALGGFVGVLTMIALAGLIGAALSRGIAETV